MNRTMFAALSAAVISIGTGNQAAAMPPADPSCFGQAVSSLAQTTASVAGEAFGQAVRTATEGGETLIIACSPPQP